MDIEMLYSPCFPHNSAFLSNTWSILTTAKANMQKRQLRETVQLYGADVVINIKG